MTEFKVGDAVERAGRASKLWLDFTAMDAGPYVVTSTTAGGWIQINGYKGTCGFNTHPFEASRFELVEQDDPLPPAPESTSYYEGTPGGAHLLVERGWSGLVRIQAKRPGGVTGVVLDPDAALQLAHDLTRMAMEIKRKEKQQERKTTLSPAIVHPYGEYL